MYKQNDTRYPYTYACDFLRCIAGYNEGGTKLSRSDASRIRAAIANVMGQKDEEVANMLADYYLANQNAIDEAAAKELVVMLGGNLQ